MPVVYTAATLSLAALELFVNLDADELPRDLVSVSAEIPDELPVEEIARAVLPRNWRVYPAPESTQAIGADWIRKGASAVLRVPSAVIPEESNYLINPAHLETEKIRTATAKPFQFDSRMWKRT